MKMETENWSGWLLGLGVLFVLLGAILVLHPVAGTAGLELFLAILFFFGGLAQFAFAFTARKWSGFLFITLLALIYLAAAFFLTYNPFGGAVALTLLLAAMLIASGCVKIAMSQALKAFGNAGWLLFDGFMGILLGVMIIIGWPTDAAWVLGLLLGISMFFGGITFLVLSSAMKRTNLGIER
ncbi:Uncharacterised protein [Candidatus Norongarragalina meridionalis]|nr:Uncharacterised protein [Candidatus Norongarragalina meridionalis]